MELRIGVVADIVNMTTDGKINIIGMFDGVFAASAPAVHPSLYIYAQLHARVADGTEHTAQIAVVNADGQEIVPRSPELPLSFGVEGPGRPLIGQLVVHMPHLRFPEFGDYEVQVFVDGRFVGDISISLCYMEPPG